MPNILLSGPAGAGKSGLLQVLLADGPLTVGIDYQALFSALTGVVRNAAGRYPLRDAVLVPLVDKIRLAAIELAVEAGHRVVATNSSGDPVRRQLLLDLLSTAGELAEEQVIDPGIDVARARLSDPQTGEVMRECEKAIARWYDPSGKILFDVKGTVPPPRPRRRRRR